MAPLTKSIRARCRPTAWGSAISDSSRQQLYASAQATPFVQQFYGAAGEHLENGLQLYLQLRLGYRIELFQHRWFIEPSLACNYWPVNTNFPAAFQSIEDDAPDYYLFEPGLHFGYKF